MKAETKVKKRSADAEVAFAPEVVERVLGIAAELHAEELTLVRRSELFDAAAHAGIPAKYVAAALEKMETRPKPTAPPAAKPAPTPAPTPAPAAADAPPWAGIAVFVGILFATSLASVYLADLAEPWASPFGLERWSMAAKLALCFVIWLVGLVGVLVAIGASEG